MSTVSDAPSVLLVVEQLRRRVPGGIGTMVRGLLQGLALVPRDRAPVGIDLYASRGPRRGDPLGAFGLPVRSSHLPGPLMTRAWDRRLGRVPAGVDVVHATSLAVPPVRRARVAVTIHDLAWRTLPDAFPRRGRRWHERALARVLGDDAVLVVSGDQVADELAAAGAAAGRLRVIPFGSDHLPPPDPGAAGALLERLGIRGEFLLSVGTLEPRKNLRRLFEAYALARPRLPAPWPLVVVGPTGWGPDVPRVPGVVPAGRVAEATLAALYERAWLLAYVPLAEGFGFPPLEAMRLGAPVVSSPVPSAAGAAVEADPRRVESIADALVALATDNDLRRRTVAAGRAHAVPLTWGETARRHLELWESLA